MIALYDPNARMETSAQRKRYRYGERTVGLAGGLPSSEGTAWYDVVEDIPRWCQTQLCTAAMWQACGTILYVIRWCQHATSGLQAPIAILMEALSTRLHLLQYNHCNLYMRDPPSTTWRRPCSAARMVPPCNPPPFKCVMLSRIDPEIFLGQRTH
jgi:hypothetical protein